MTTAERLLLLAVLTTAVLVASTQVAHGADRYEKPPVLRAADLIPAELLEGDRHIFDPDVPTDGFMAYFTIHSDYGTYKAASLGEAMVRVREIYAIAALDEMSRARVAGEAVVEGVKSPFLAVKSVVSRPTETAKSLGQGLGRWIGRGKLSLEKARYEAEEVYDQAKESYDERREERLAQREAMQLAEQEVRERALDEGRDPDAAVAEYRQRSEAEDSSALASQADAQRNQERIEWATEQVEKAAYKYLGYDKARRRLAQKLQVDPYTTNLQLQERLDSMSWALWAGQFGTGYVMPSSELLGYVQDVDDLVWTTHPKDLEVEKRDQLEALGVDGRTIHAFFENRLYTTSQRTAMVSRLSDLEGVANRSHFFHLAATVDNWRLAAYYERSARLLARAHAQQPLASLVARSEKLVAAVRRSGDAVLLLPVDHLAWTESLDLVASSVERQRREVGFEGGITLLLAGDLTPRARQGVEMLGWAVEARSL